MEKIFTIQRNPNQPVIFNVAGIDDLTIGDIFFRRNEDNTTDILQDFEYLDKIYLDSILDKLLDNKQYDFSLLESKLI